MSAQNKIIEGYYKGRKIKNNISYNLYFEPTSYRDAILLTKDHVNKYEVITEDTVKSASSAVLRGAGGALLFGGIGILAGLSAKNKSTYLIALEFKNGERSLIEIDNNMYKIFLRGMF